jgi:hypothetical protein
MGTADRLKSKSAIPISLSQISLSGPIQLSFQPIQRLSLFSPPPPTDPQANSAHCTNGTQAASQPARQPSREKRPRKTNKSRTLGLQPGQSHVPRESRGGRRSLRSLARTLHSPIPTSPFQPSRKKTPQKTNNPEESGSNREHPFLPRGPRRSLGSSRFASFRRSPPFLRINPNPTPILPFLISNNFNRWQEIPTLKPGDLISGPGCIRRSRHRWPRTLTKGYRTGIQNEEGSLHALRLAARLELHMRVSHCPQPLRLLLAHARAQMRLSHACPLKPIPPISGDSLSVHHSLAFKFPPPESSLELRSADPDARSTRIGWVIATVGEITGFDHGITVLVS